MHLSGSDSDDNEGEPAHIELQDGGGDAGNGAEQMSHHCVVGVTRGRCLVPVSAQGECALVQCTSAY